MVIVRGTRRIALLAVAAALSPAVAQATTARALSLRTHFAFADDTDVFRFPSAAPPHGDLATVDFTPSAQDGNAGVLWGKTLTLGVHVNRPAAFDDVAEIDALYDGVDAPQVRKIVDLILAGRLTEQHLFGLSLGPSFGMDTIDADIPGDDRGRLSTGSRAFQLDVGLGHSFLGEVITNDASVALSFHSIEQQANGETIAESGGAPSFALRDRLIWQLSQDRAVGAEVLIGRRSYNVDLPGDPSSNGRYGRWLLQLDAGPRFALAQDVTLATALRMTFEQITGTTRDGSADPEDGPGALSLGFPGAVFAIEARVLRRWHLRAGADYLFRYQAFETPVGFDLDPTQTRSTGTQFSWSLGLGYERSGFSLDALLASALVLNGPDFLGGTAPGMFASLSGGYRWE